MLGGIWEIAFCASPVRALLGQVMASVYSAGQAADALLADAEFRALGSAPGSTPLRGGRSGRGHGPDGGAVQTGHRPADRGTATRGAETWPFLVVLTRRWHMGQNDEKRRAWRSAAASAAWPVAMTRDVSPTSTVRACRSAGPASIVKTAAFVSGANPR